MNLTDYEVEQLFCSDRHEILSRLNNPVLLKYLKNKNSVNLQTSNNIECNYYTENDFNLKVRYSAKSNLSTFHINIRKLGLHRNELIAFLSMLNISFDVIILTEVGRFSERYITTLFTDYEAFYDLPSENDYGGVAIFVYEKLEAKEIYKISHKKCEMIAMHLPEIQTINIAVYRPPKTKKQCHID